MDILMLGLSLIRHAIQSETGTRIAHYLIRQGTALVVKEIQRRTKRHGKFTM